MFDWGCHALWLDGPSGLANVDPAALGVSSELATAVRTWTAEAEATYDAGNPARSGFSNPLGEAAWVSEGRALALRLAEEIGFEVSYHNWSTGQDEPLENPDQIRTAKP